eukprot:TRINITY_DN3365_c0_g1_i1.p1 TRINITY_DN3365_c0_g1~~TRINITY_DN3365_c0_g1_i1.p1  ORF type:complete len:409 (-),score=78.79 TRINITY_DN3365_c0_g1_i1:218-1444(-)
MVSTADFIIPERGLKLFYKMLQCCSKVGEELHIDASKRKITFRSLNTSRSAYFAFNFSDTFFESYKIGPTDVGRCKVHLKSCIAVFKSVQNVQECQVRIDNQLGKVIFDASCKYDMKKLFRINYEECEIPQAIYTKDQCKSRFICQPRLLSDSLANFHSAVDEVTLIVSPEMLKIKSYFDEHDVTQIKFLQTELAIESSDFDEYIVDGEVGDLTFCLKEFKAILSFCEYSGQPLQISVEKAGRPVIFTVKVTHDCEADFVLATLVDTTSQSSQRSGTTSHPGNPVVNSEIRPETLATENMTMRDGHSLTVLGSPNEDKEPIAVSPMVEKDVFIRPTPLRPSDQQVIATSPAPMSEIVVDSVPLVENSRDDDDEYVEGTPPHSPDGEERSSKRSRTILGTQTYEPLSLQ